MELNAWELVLIEKVLVRHVLNAIPTGSKDSAQQYFARSVADLLVKIRAARDVALTNWHREIG